jgi:hypothetical protein
VRFVFAGAVNYPTAKDVRLFAEIMAQNFGFHQ